MSDYESRYIAIQVDKLWDLVRDAYEEAINEPEDEDTGVRQHFSRSQSRKQVIEFLEWYWQAKHDQLGP